jgi:serine/threonine-protein kinase
MLEPSLYRAHADIARASALLGNYELADAFLEAPPIDTGDLNTYWFYSARMCAWRGDVAIAKRMQERVVASDFPLKRSIGVILGLVITGVMPKAMYSELDTWGKVTSRARRRPIFFRQLSAEMASIVKDAGVALDAIEAADGFGLIDVAWLDRCPLLAPFRGEARFAAVRKSAGARAAEVLAALGE